MRRFFSFFAVALQLAVAASLHGQSGSASAQTQDVVTKQVSARLKQLDALTPAQRVTLSPDLKHESWVHFGVALESTADMSSQDSFVSTWPQLINQQLTTQHVVIDNLHPVIVKPARVVITGSQVFPDLDQLFSPQKLDALSKIMPSVGRIRFWFIDPSTGTPILSPLFPNGRLAGSGFVIAPGVLATACHVLVAFASQVGNSMALPDNMLVKVDFGTVDRAEHSFVVKQVLGCGQVPGFDAALLRVDVKSDDGTTDLPPPLTLDATGNTATNHNIGVAGYPLFPVVCDSSSTVCPETAKWFNDLKTAHPDAIKLISPGKVTGVFKRDTFSVLTYDAPTGVGQSGSPVLDLETLKVVGIHYCCTGEVPSPEPVACATIHPISLGSKSDNEAVRLRDLFSDPSLNDVLQPVVATKP